MYCLLIWAAVCISPSWADDSSALTSQPVSNGANNASVSGTNTDTDKSQSDAKTGDSMHTNNLAPGKNGKTSKAKLPKKCLA